MAIRLYFLYILIILLLLSCRSRNIDNYFKTMNTSELKAAVNKEVTENILSYWIEKTVDNENGGFYGEVKNKGQIVKDANRSAVVNMRILWTFANAYRIFKKDEYKIAAEHAYEYIKKYFIDKDNGGVYWMLDYKGNPIDTKKQSYAQGFAIYGLAALHRATGNKEALELAIEIHKLLEEHAFDPAYGGYLEAYTADWKLMDDLRLSSKEPNEKKTMNTHLHILEPYTELYRSWKDEGLRNQIIGLIRVFIDHILNKENYHFNLFFEEDWTVKSEEISYGHDIEGSWLLFEAAEVLGDEALIQEVGDVAVKMAEATLNEAIQNDGGLVYEGDPNGIIDTDRHWWPQAEAVIGFYNAYQISGDKKYLDAAINSWNYIEKYIVDKKFGEWFWLADKNGNPKRSEHKVGPWKCPYHNSRTCFEIIERVK